MNLSDEDIEDIEAVIADASRELFVLKGKYNGFVFQQALGLIVGWIFAEYPPGEARDIISRDFMTHVTRVTNNLTKKYNPDFVEKT